MTGMCGWCGANGVVFHMEPRGEVSTIADFNRLFICARCRAEIKETDARAERARKYSDQLRQRYEERRKG